jgi:hypothetical protein
MWKNIENKWVSPDEKYNQGKDEDGNMSFNDKTFKKFIEKSFDVIKKIDEIKLPQKNEQLRLITNKPFNSISIIQYIAEKETIEEIIFVIFAINQYAAKVICDLYKNGKIKKAIIIVSSIRNAGHKSKSIAVDMLKKFFDVIYVNSHAKITLIKTKDNYYNIEGSGNMSFNGRFEQYVIDNDKKFFDFSREWIKEIEKYKMK